MKMALRILLFCSAVGLNAQSFNLVLPSTPVPYAAQSFNLPIPSPVPGINLPIPSPVPGINLPIPSPVPVPGADLG